MFKLEFDPTDTKLAAAIGRALMEYAGQEAPASAGIVSVGKSASTATDDNPSMGSADVASEDETQNTSNVSQLSVDSATGPGTSTTTQTSDPARVDEKGVAFDAKMCAKAAKPFYASGPMKGQWKKKGGAEGPTQEAYDAWYAEQLAAAPKVETEDTGFDVANQFAGGGQQQQAAPDNSGPIPDTMGKFLAWVSERQTAGRISAQDVTNAYMASGLTIQDIMDTNPNAAGNCATLVAIIESVGG